jgi:hypothetical protein
MLADNQAVVVLFAENDKSAEFDVFEDYARHTTGTFVHTFDAEVKKAAGVESGNHLILYK